jgi:hypothetical protein
MKDAMSSVFSKLHPGGGVKCYDGVFYSTAIQYILQFVKKQIIVICTL